MKTNLKNDLLCLLLIAIPFIYLEIEWNSLPEEVPLHWNARGEIDRWGSKTTLWVLPIVVTLLPYLLLVIIPFIDPKKGIQRMGNKYEQLKLIMVLLMSGLTTVILYITRHPQLNMGFAVMVFVGVLFLALGNYFQTIKPNYFVGIRTPWTLESEYVWKETHKFGGKLWVVAGLLVIAVTVLLPLSAVTAVLNIAILLAATFIPLVYSYTLYQKEKKAV